MYGVRTGTDHDDPEPIIRTALHIRLASSASAPGIDLVAHDRDMIARIEQLLCPAAGS